MSEIIIGSYRGKGTANQITDQVKTYNHVRPNGDHLAIAVVADGGQAGKSGGYAANVAVDAAFRYLIQGNETDISDLTVNAIEFAQKTVQPVLTDSNLAGCSLAIAVIHQNKHRKRLFIAHVGNAGIYLVRDHKLIQLNLEHTFKHIAPINGKMDVETAACNPHANELQRSLGNPETFMVDIGFHVESDISKNGYQIAQVRGMRGLPIKEKDSILLCTDGLFYDTDADRSQLLRGDEVTQVLGTQEGEKAARVLVSFALGRNAQDNVTAAVLQTEDPRRKVISTPLRSRSRGQSAFFYGAIASILLLCLVAGLIVFDGRDEALAASTPSTELVEAITTDLDRQVNALKTNSVVSTATEVIPPTLVPTVTNEPTAQPAATEEPTVTPLPTATLRPTLVPVPIGIQKYANEEEMRMLTEDEWIFAREDLELHIDTLPLGATDASLYLEEGSEIEIDQVNRAIMFRLFDLSDVLIETGDYPDGAQIEARTSSDDVLFSVDGSCMAVAFNQAASQLQATCFEGNCMYKIGRHSSVTIPTGSRVSLNPADVEAEPIFEPISLQMAATYRDFLSQFAGGPDDIQACLTPYLAPPATSTPWPTATSLPTATVVPVQVNQPSNPNPPDSDSPVTDPEQPPTVEPTPTPGEFGIALEVTIEIFPPTPSHPTPTPGHGPTATPDPAHPTPPPAHGPTATPDPAHPTPPPAHGPTATPDPAHPTPPPVHGPTATPDPAHPTPPPAHDPTATPDHGQPTATPYHEPTEPPVHPTPTPNGEADVAPTVVAFPPTSTPTPP